MTCFEIKCIQTNELYKDVYTLTGVASSLPPCLHILQKYHARFEKTKLHTLRYPPTLRTTSRKTSIPARDSIFRSCLPIVVKKQIQIKNKRTIGLNGHLSRI